ncbi:MAG: isoprenylcysteine carboxylmethyltransferase family protein [Paracoccaceae bacterium]|nr:isoprenylcysteine carboxylmethyltransferase family protein [Paracoccaceae bacterium]
MGRVLDWPPVWLLGALAAVWGLGQALPWPLFGGMGRGVGAVLVLAGLLLMALAVAQMTRARTSVIPRAQPAALVTGGVFGLSRNPIYLGDVLVLAGAVLWWDVPLALPLIPGLMAVLQARFIRGEEARLRAAFGPAFDAWAARVRRWI